MRLYIPETLKTYGLIIALIAGSFWFTWKFVPPPPPSTITFAAGSLEGDYYAFAKIYQEKLKAQGIDLVILETKGSVDNINLIQEGKADAGFSQTGIRSEIAGNDVQSLGSLYYEPLWVFVPRTMDINDDLKALEGKTIAVGQEGSGTYILANQLLNLNGLGDKVTRLDLSSIDAVPKLKTGELDALFTVGRASSETIQALLKTEDLKAMSFDRADGYTKILPYVSKVTLHEGSISLSSNTPDQSIDLISPVAQLIVSPDFNGSLKSLLVRLAAETHNQDELFSDTGQFPTAQYVDFPLADEASRFFKYGPNIVQRYLPFWFADLVNRMVVLLIPLLGVMIPLLKIASPTYRWRIRSKIYRWYKALKAIEFEKPSEDEDVHDTLKTLSKIEKDVKKTKVPLSYSDELYNLRLHIQMVRQNLESQKK